MEAVSFKYSESKNYIGGQLVDSNNRQMDVYSPLTGEKISTVVLSSATEPDHAVQAAKKALPAWANLTVKKGFKYSSNTDNYWRKIEMS